MVSSCLQLSLLTTSNPQEQLTTRPHYSTREVVYDEDQILFLTETSDGVWRGGVWNHLGCKALWATQSHQVNTAISCPSFPVHHGKLTSHTAVQQGCLVHQQAVVSCRCLLTSVVIVAADVIEGGRWQDTERRAGEATREWRVVDNPCLEAAGASCGVAP